MLATERTQATKADIPWTSQKRKSSRKASNSRDVRNRKGPSTNSDIPRGHHGKTAIAGER
jgi:hypothetical protein